MGLRDPRGTLGERWVKIVDIDEGLLAFDFGVETRRSLVRRRRVL